VKHHMGNQVSISFCNQESIEDVIDIVQIVLNIMLKINIIFYES